MKKKIFLWVIIGVLAALAIGVGSYSRSVNTAVNERTGQSSADPFSSGLVQSAHRSPTATPGVPFDDAKV